MKKIIHQKIPLEKNSGNMIMDYTIAKGLHEHIQELVGDDYIVVTTPTELDLLDENEKIISIEAKKYSLKEITKIINKYNEMTIKQ